MTIQARKLGGWWRLWMVVSTLWLLLIWDRVYSDWAEPFAPPIQLGTEARQGLIRSLAQAAKAQGKPVEIAAAEIKQALDDSAAALGRAEVPSLRRKAIPSGLLLLTGLPLGLLTLGLTVRWVFRGFRASAARP